MGRCSPPVGAGRGDGLARMGERLAGAARDPPPPARPRRRGPPRVGLVANRLAAAARLDRRRISDPSERVPDSPTPVARSVGAGRPMTDRDALFAAVIANPGDD